MTTLHDIQVRQLSCAYAAEKIVAGALPAIEDAATSERLKRILRKHVKESVHHVRKLELVFKHFGAEPGSLSNNISSGLIAEAEQMVEAFGGTAVIDAALICSMQKIEHHEIAVYGCLREWSELLGNEAATAILSEILEEKKTANESLTQLARACSNEEANIAETNCA